MEYKSETEQETIKIGQKIADKLKAGDIVLLEGNLGAGKTTLTKGILEFFKIFDAVSPTFTLMQIYKIKKLENQEIKNIAHIDTYRLEDEQELIDIGVEDYLDDKNTISIIEWPEKIKSLLTKKKVIYINMETTGKNLRKIVVRETTEKEEEKNG